MLSATSIARLAEVHPALAARIRALDAFVPALNLQVVQGLRTWAQQDALYQQGRTAPGAIVTNCPGGHSWHNFGLAVDLVPEDIEPGQPDWDVNHPAWQQMVAAGESLGLVSGSEWKTFKDYPHFQLTGKLPVNPDDATRQLFSESGLRAVWDAAQIPPAAGNPQP
jgi:peptidoglycan LD-endopeptidase CwlK